MNPKEFAAIARRLMSCPAAPYYEAGVRAVVELICTENGLAFQRDQFGNVIVRLGSARAGRPFVLAAHMDHPGFEIVRPLGSRRWAARFNGGVPDSFFHPGTPVRLLPGVIPARLGRRLGADNQFEVIASRIDLNHQPQPHFVVWELEDFAVRNGKIHGRSCDDLVGVASVLAAMIDLERARASVHVLGVISRAEEIGFQGALTVADAKLLPRNSLIVSLETSRELPPTKMGRGVILRVGDRSSIFDSAGKRFLGEVAAGLQAKDIMGYALVLFNPNDCAEDTTEWLSVGAPGDGNAVSFACDTHQYLSASVRASSIDRGSVVPSCTRSVRLWLPGSRSALRIRAALSV